MSSERKGTCASPDPDKMKRAQYPEHRHEGKQRKTDDIGKCRSGRRGSGGRRIKVAAGMLAVRQVQNGAYEPVDGAVQSECAVPRQETAVKVTRQAGDGGERQKDLAGENAGGGEECRGPQGKARRVRFVMEAGESVVVPTNATNDVNANCDDPENMATRVNGRYVCDTKDLMRICGYGDDEEISKADAMAKVSKQLDAWLKAQEAEKERSAGDVKRELPTEDEATPTALKEALTIEMQRQDKKKAKALLLKTLRRQGEEVEAQEQALQMSKRRKRLEHTKVRRERWAERTRLAGGTVKVEGFPRRHTGGGAKDSCDAHEAVADQLVVAVARPDVIRGIRWKETANVPLHITRTRRRYEKLVRKAKARAKRKLLTWLEIQQCSEEAFFAFEDAWHRSGESKSRMLTSEEASAMGFTLPTVMKVVAKRAGRRGHAKQYAYHSGSVYQGPRVQQAGVGERHVRVGRLRAVQAPTIDSLPTARVKTKDEWRNIKLDTGAQYSVAGEGWQTVGTLQDVLPPVDYVEGFTGAVAKVLGVRRFRFQTQYGQDMAVDALVVEGAVDEFLQGEDWMLHNGVKIDFTSCEMK